MSDMLSRIYTLLLDVILPNLKSVQASQAEQRKQTDSLNRAVEEFRAELQLRLAEIALCRQELEDARVTLRESGAAEGPDAPPSRKKRIVQ